MEKVTRGPQPWICPTPALLIGVEIDGKPNVMTAAWGGVANSEPPMVAVGVRPGRYTLRGIRHSLAFSINVPSVDMVKEVDFCGIHSGARIDKISSCGFGISWGSRLRVPLIDQCPLNLECEVRHIVELPSHALIVAEVMETHISGACVSEDGTIDLAQVNPLVFLPKPTNRYCRLGDEIAEAFSIGKRLPGHAVSD